MRIANRGSPTQMPVPTLYFHVMLEKGEDENQARNRADRIFGIVQTKSKQYNKLNFPGDLAPYRVTSRK